MFDARLVVPHELVRHAREHDTVVTSVEKYIFFTQQSSGPKIVWSFRCIINIMQFKIKWLLVVVLVDILS